MRAACWSLQRRRRLQSSMHLCCAAHTALTRMHFAAEEAPGARHTQRFPAPARARPPSSCPPPPATDRPVAGPTRRPPFRAQPRCVNSGPTLCPAPLLLPADEALGRSPRHIFRIASPVLPVANQQCLPTLSWLPADEALVARYKHTMLDISRPEEAGFVPAACEKNFGSQAGSAGEGGRACEGGRQAPRRRVLPREAAAPATACPSSPASVQAVHVLAKNAGRADPPHLCSSCQDRHAPDTLLLPPETPLPDCPLC